MLADNQRLCKKIFSLGNLDTVLQLPQPRMQSRGHSPRLVEVGVLVGKSDGHRKYAERLVAVHRGVVLLPSHVVNDQ